MTKNTSLLLHKLNLVRKICRGLESIHKKELVHRDFHPGNILLNNLFFGLLNDYYCYITDLGLCRSANEKDNDMVYGVLPYVAPEVLLGKPYTQASDIYSFGIVIYEI